MNVRVTRAEFESLCPDLFDRVRGPLLEVVRLADIPMVLRVRVPMHSRLVGPRPHSLLWAIRQQANVSSLTLMGGGLRIPQVQAVLKATFGRYAPPPVKRTASGSHSHVHQGAWNRTPGSSPKTSTATRLPCWVRSPVFFPPCPRPNPQLSAFFRTLPKASLADTTACCALDLGKQAPRSRAPSCRGSSRSRRCACLTFSRTRSTSALMAPARRRTTMARMTRRPMPPPPPPRQRPRPSSSSSRRSRR